MSPKPIHYPTPANIPILQNQIDPVFNQTATHMALPQTQQSQTATQPQASDVSQDSTNGGVGEPDVRNGNGNDMMDVMDTSDEGPAQNTTTDSGLNNESANLAQAPTTIDEPTETQELSLIHI